MKRFFKYFFLVILAIFILIQLYPRPKKNNDNSRNPADIAVTFSTPADVQNILKNSCNDCHSNYTSYPWYASIQPVAWWLGDHITEGKKELNFSEFGTYSLRKKYKKFEEIIKEVEDDKMPIDDYLKIHSDAKLSPGEKTILIKWATFHQGEMKRLYPADSLIRKK